MSRGGHPTAWPRTSPHAGWSFLLAIFAPASILLVYLAAQVVMNLPIVVQIVLVVGVLVLIGSYGASVFGPTLILLAYLAAQVMNWPILAPIVLLVGALVFFGSYGASVVFGFIAIRRIRRSGGTLQGVLPAVVGIVLSVVSVGLPLLFVVILLTG